MTLSYDLFFQSGLIDQVNYSEGDNISLIEIQNSDQDYYQNGFITLFDVPSSQTLGDSVLIKINDTVQFDGYIARREQEIKYGKKSDTYQIIGKTYDLWRYHTGIVEEVSGMTGYIASSLVADYATGISGRYTYVNSGTNITELMDFSNLTIGDALVKLTEIDGYKFYVDTDDELHHYKPGVKKYNFTITESEIIDMSPVEEADEDLINEVRVVGGTDYSTKTQVMGHASANSLPCSPYLLAQRFKAEDTILTAIKLYLHRSASPNMPGTMNIEIWPHSSSTNTPKASSSSIAIEWSDDISITSGELPYPPDWTGWQTYTSPKLSLTKDEYYWLVLRYDLPSNPSYTAVWYDYFQTDQSADWTLTDVTYDHANDKRLEFFSDEGNYGIAIRNWDDIVPSSSCYYYLWTQGYFAGTVGKPFRIYWANNSMPELKIYESTTAGNFNLHHRIPHRYIHSGLKFYYSMAGAGAGTDLGWIASSAVYKLDNNWLYYSEKANKSSYPSGELLISSVYGVDCKWSGSNHFPYFIPTGSITFQLGWTQGEITAAASNQTSIDSYGRHFKVITDSTINTLEMAQARADAAVSGMESIPKKGTITIDGRTDLSENYRFSANLTNFNIEDIWNVVSYTQRINEQGFTSEINFGRQPFDIMKKIADLED